MYEALDKTTGDRVALKVLTHISPDELYRFKREFRVLTDVTEDNLVTLHELFVDEAGVFFTMALIRGTDFVSYVRGEEDVLDLQRLRSGLEQLTADWSRCTPRESCIEISSPRTCSFAKTATCSSPTSVWPRT